MKFLCEVCGYEYDESLGEPDNNIESGTAFSALPSDYLCPLCGVDKTNFIKTE